MGAGHSCGACCPPTDECEEDGGIGFVDSLSVLDWGPGNEPVGQVFEETLAHLGTLDRQLLLFCATTSLAAVRWLMHLGGCIDVCDANGSTCLHVACRSGALSVVRAVMQHATLLDATDVASWTPLHIAAHMGRREAALRLLRARASPQCRNVRGQTPLDLCMDIGTLEVLRGSLPEEQDDHGDFESTQVIVTAGGNISAGVGDLLEDDSVGIPLRCEPECFLVNPSPIIRATAPHRKALLHIAAVIFNMRPSHGLAFAVVSGIVESYTGAMRLFLQNGCACRIKLGSFLGEAFSLCTLIRFSVFDFMPLLNTGVISSLSRAFSVLQLPEDLQKIDRLVRGLAHVWWRKHKALDEGLADGQTSQLCQEARASKDLQSKAQDGDQQSELQGLELKQYLAGSDALCQLMLSAVLLHWFVHANGSGPSRQLSFEAWLALNRGIEAGGTDVPEHVQRRVHAVVCESFREELVLSKPTGLSGQPAGSPGEEGGGAGALSVCATLEGWVEILDSTLAGPEASARDGTCGEHTASAGLAQGLGSGRSGMLQAAFASATGGAGGNKGTVAAGVGGRVWASLCSIFLLFATSPGDDAGNAPYVLTDARHLRVAHVSTETLGITLQGVPGKNTPDKLEIPITFVLLLADGRWREVRVTKLDLKVETAEELQSWVSNLVQLPANQFIAI